MHDNHTFIIHLAKISSLRYLPEMNSVGSIVSAVHPRDRLAGLNTVSRALMQQALSDISSGRHASAAPKIANVLAAFPEHPEALRLLALVQYRAGAPHDAVDILRRALRSWPDDVPILCVLGGLLDNLGQIDEALVLLRQACSIAPTFAPAWFNLGRLLNAQAETEAARDALRQAIDATPEHVPARLLYAGTLSALGDIEGAAAEYRRTVAIDPRAAQGWLGLVNLKTIRLDTGEIALLERLHAMTTIPDVDRSSAAFALGKVREDQARYHDAFALLQEANASVRRRLPWDAEAFSTEIDAITAAFPDLPATTDNDGFGQEVLFIVSLPRSGSTLIEQILAAHPDVEGASELPDMEVVIEEESRRRGTRFPDWVALANTVDWRRLGERYLERTQRWRNQAGHFTDKMPDNWRLAGAAMMMLPGARIVHAQRDPIETCWSCFKHLFGAGRQLQSYALADLGAHWRDYDRLTRHWSKIAPRNFRDFRYETLLADPEPFVRELLGFCGLPYDEACLRFHETTRPVRTASAAQVREPLRHDTARTARYGALLDPLREALGMERDKNS